MALFTLKITDNVVTVDFMGSDYRVENGGFDISLPRVKRELMAQRPGFYLPTMSYYEYREAKLRFSVYGSTRAVVITRIQALERIFRHAAARTRMSAGRRVELSYAWDGAAGITYFEVYAGDLIYPPDVLSVEGVHRKEGGNFVVVDCELTLFLSATGYGISLYSDALIAIPLANGGTAKTTNGVPVQNPGTGQYNYVEIDGADLLTTIGGSSPIITKVSLESGTPYTSWSMLYMGLQQSPFPSKIVYDDADLVKVPSGTTSVNDANAHGGSYRSKTYIDANPVVGTFSDWAWSVTSTSVGMFYTFLHSFQNIPQTVQFAVGIDDFVTYGIQYQEDYVKAGYSSFKILPLGAIPLPPTGFDLANYGTIHPDLWLGIWQAREVATSLVTVDYLSLLPIGSGLRIWRSRVSALTGTMVDDGWRGLEYLKDGSNRVATPFYGLMEPIKLEPGITQRVYFTSLGLQTALSERQRQFIVKMYGVPTYSSLAL